MSGEAVTFTICGRLPGLNEYTEANRAHRQRGATLKRRTENRIMLFAQAARLPVLDGPVFVSFAWHEPNRRRDADNVAFAKKFILDALVRCGILADDGRKHVIGFADSFAVDPADPRVVVTLERRP